MINRKGSSFLKLLDYTPEEIFGNPQSERLQSFLAKVL